MTHKLKTCPFCGNVPELDVEAPRQGRTDAWAFVRCRRCRVAPSVSGCMDTGYYSPQSGWNWVVSRTFEEASADAVAQAVRAWNDRPAV